MISMGRNIGSISKSGDSSTYATEISCIKSCGMAKSSPNISVDSTFDSLAMSNDSSSDVAETLLPFVLRNS